MKKGKQEEDVGTDSLKHVQFPESIGNKDTEQEDCAGYPDESKEEIESLFYGRYVSGSD